MVILKANNILAIVDQLKIYVNDDSQGELLENLLIVAALQNTYLDNGNARHLIITLCF